MSKPVQVGMNLASVTFYSTEYPFIDRMKSAGGWAALGADQSLLRFNKDGYPLNVPAGAPNVFTMVGVDPISAGNSNTYVLTYTGQADFEFIGGRVLSSEPGKIVFEYVNKDGASLPLAVKNLNPDAPLTSIHIVRSDQQGLFASGEIFNPAFTDKIAEFGTLRYMDWMNTNATSVVKWSDRTTTSSRTWQDAGDSNVPIEVMVALANKTRTNMWLNVPTKADDDYVRQMMTYVRDHLDPSLSVTLEYSNEVWNFGFQQSHYASAEAAKLWGRDANGDGVVNPADPAEGVSGGAVIYQGYRAAQIAAVANQVYAGAPDRLRNVIATQTAWLGLEGYIFDGIGRAGLGTVSSLFDDYAVTTYFGNLSGSTEADRATIMRWARSGAAGMDAAFKALKDGTGIEGDGSLASMVPIYAYQGKVAADHGLDLVAYEGGVGLVAIGFPQGDKADLMGFYARLNADPRMGELYQRTLDDFEAAGGKLANAFQDVGDDSEWGTWGTLKSIYDRGSPAWDVLVAAQREARAAGGAAPTPTPTPVPAPPTIPTPPTLPTGFTDQPTYVMADGEKVVAFVGTGSFSATGNTLDNTITAGAGGSSLSGGAGADVLVGGAGADRLDGGLGADVMTGGAGDDVYLVDDAGDAVVEKAGGGVDEVRTTLATYTLDGEVENLTFTGTGTFVGTGNALANVINGGDGGATLSGGAGDDRLFGGAGADRLDGGAGDDVLTGGAGDDTYLVDSAGDRVVETAGGGADEVRSSASAYTLSDHVEKLVFTGSGAFTGTGNDGANTITGGAGADKLYGRGGADQLVGGEGDDLLDGGQGDDVLTGGGGDDVYLVDSAGDRIVEFAGQGTDEVRTTLATYTLADTLEKLTFTGGGEFVGTGNALANVLTIASGSGRLSGGDGNDTLIGGAGADRLNGDAGDDLLDGGAGDDVLTGGAGDDVYVVDSAGDRIVEAAGQGTDEVRTAGVTFTLADNLEKLTYTGTGVFAGTGNALANVMSLGSGSGRLDGGEGNDTLLGGAGADRLDGGAGVDRMVGGAGNDVYVVDDLRDAVVEQAGGGVDEVRTALGAFILSNEVENLSYTGTGSFQALGNALDNVITGGAKTNRLLGGDGRDTLVGGGAADVLDGGAGVDRMVGGGGNDVYFVDAAGDQVVEDAGGGLDTVYSSVTFTLSANVENVQLIGMGATDAAGNDGANTMVGNAGANRLAGGGGADVLHGGGGADVLDGGDGDDSLVGDDGADQLNGGAGGDTLVGGAGDDVLAGGAGADVLTGGLGADRFVVRPGDLDADASRSDRITDFSREEGDKIDLSAFDADPSTAARNAFTFIGSAGFSKRAGELRVDASGAYQVVSGDLNGDGVADFTINLSKNAGTLIATDFAL